MGLSAILISDRDLSIGKISAKRAWKKDEAFQAHQSHPVLWLVGGTSIISLFSSQDKTVWTLSSSRCERSAVLYNREETGAFAWLLSHHHGYFIHIKTLTHVLLKRLTCLK